MSRVKRRTVSVPKIIIFGVLLSSSLAFAQAASLQDMGSNILKSYNSFGTLLIDMAYLAGIGFGLTAVLKFKQHKDNPAQTSIGTSFAMLGISVFLVTLPSIYSPAGRSLFGDDITNAGITGRVTADTANVQGFSDLPHGEG